jgi:branched-chain amino acid transport system substrate-binding protein
MLALYRKDPNDPQWKDAADVKAWREFMAKYMPNSDVRDDSHNYGYSVSHTMIEVLKKCGDTLTRENVMKQAASLKGFEAPMLLPGIKINTSATDFYPIQSVRLGRVKGESFELFGDILSNESA